MIGRNLVGTTLTATLIGLSSAAGAAQFDFIGTANGGAVNATAEFTVSAGLLTIELTNNQTLQRSSGQAISDLHWTINGGDFTTIPTPETCLAAPQGSACYTAHGSYININDNGTSTPAGNDLDKWGISNSGGTYNLTTLTGQQPKGLIWGDGVTNVNDGADNFNPYVDKSATFTLAIAGLLDTAVISDVVFTFGTNGAVGVPIPAAVWLFGSGLMGLVAIARRRQGSLMRGSPALT